MQQRKEKEHASQHYVFVPSNSPALISTIVRNYYLQTVKNKCNFTLLIPSPRTLLVSRISTRMPDKNDTLVQLPWCIITDIFFAEKGSGCASSKPPTQTLNDSWI